MYISADEISKTGSSPIYIQVYEHFRDDILKGDIKAGERLPSLRRLSKDLGVSITAVTMAYSQLTVEGYVTPKENSGYYVNDVATSLVNPKAATETEVTSPIEEEYIYDARSFDFARWRKCLDRVLSDYSPYLLREGDPQGEYMLRREIAKYVYSSRGVTAAADQIVIAAGTQQITMQLARLLRKTGIGHVALEDPGYAPVGRAFSDSDFAVTRIPVESDGIVIEKLPANISCACYVSPSNQFPTGAVMPIGRRQALLSWARENNSLIIEDDYDSELRYFGRPIPALQGLDNEGRVIYLGSFSSTLYPAVKISYMVLPPDYAKLFTEMKNTYTQTCSVTEQLTLALFMNEGLYASNIRKQRNLYSQKLAKIRECLKDYPVTLGAASSGVSIILTADNSDDILNRAVNLNLNMARIEGIDNSLILYYNQIPLDDIPRLINILFKEEKL